MRKLLTICLILLLCASSYGIPRDSTRDNIGAYTGPRAGTQQDDNIKASLDLLHVKVGAATSGTSGDTWYVDSAEATGTEDGKTWLTATDTINEAVDLASAGDTILVADGHAETLGTLELDVAGLSIIALGEGSRRATISYDGTGDEIIIDAAGIIVSGLRFIAGIAEVGNAFDLQDDSDYFLIIDCEFPEPGTATFEFDKVFQLVTGADNGTIAKCTVINQAATPGMTSVIDGGAAAIDSLTLIANYVNVDADVAALLFSDQADTNLRIVGNTIIQEDIDQFCIELTSTATGMIESNVYANLGGSLFVVDPGSCHQAKNVANYAINSASQDFPLIPGKDYFVTMNMPSAIDDDLFSVVGGPILIKSLTALCSTAIGAASTWTVILDHATLGDTEFTTAVDVDTLAAGGTLVFTAANGAVITILNVGANVGSTNLMDSWFCPIGMIEVVEDEAGTTGVVDWFMTFTPLTEGVTVTPQ